MATCPWNQTSRLPAGLCQMSALGGQGSGHCPAFSSRGGDSGGPQASFAFHARRRAFFPGPRRLPAPRHRGCQPARRADWNSGPALPPTSPLRVVFRSAGLSHPTPTVPFSSVVSPLCSDSCHPPVRRASRFSGTSCEPSRGALRKSSYLAFERARGSGRWCPCFSGACETQRGRATAPKSHSFSEAEAGWKSRPRVKPFLLSAKAGALSGVAREWGPVGEVGPVCLHRSGWPDPLGREGTVEHGEVLLQERVSSSRRNIICADFSDAFLSLRPPPSCSPAPPC